MKYNLRKIEKTKATKRKIIIVLMKEREVQNSFHSLLPRCDNISAFRVSLLLPTISFIFYEEPSVTEAGLQNAERQKRKE